MKRTRIILGGKKGLPPSRISYPYVDPPPAQRKPRPLMRPIKRSDSRSIVQQALRRKKLAW